MAGRYKGPHPASPEGKAGMTARLARKDEDAQPPSIRIAFFGWAPAENGDQDQAPEARDPAKEDPER
jgi:hypothetical protein